jgi:hypothetical protein
METKECPLCLKEKSIKEFKDERFYREHQVCMDCCRKASRRLDLLTSYDMDICKRLDLDYDLLNSYKGRLFDEQFGHGRS